MILDMLMSRSKGLDRVKLELNGFQRKKEVKDRKMAKDKQPAVLSKGSYFIMIRNRRHLVSSVASCCRGVLHLIEAWDGSSYCLIGI